jgi:hypothetical protein
VGVTFRKIWIGRLDWVPTPDTFLLRSEPRGFQQSVSGVWVPVRIFSKRTPEVERPRSEESRGIVVRPDDGSPFASKSLFQILSCYSRRSRPVESCGVRVSGRRWRKVIELQCRWICDSRFVAWICTGAVPFLYRTRPVICSFPWPFAASIAWCNPGARRCEVITNQ